MVVAGYYTPLISGLAVQKRTLKRARGAILSRQTDADDWMNWESLNQSQSGIYIDTELGGASNTVIPAFAGIQGTVKIVFSWTPAYAGVTKDFAPSGCAKTNTLPITEADSGVKLNVVLTLVSV